MAERRDSKNRLLNRGEYQKKDGRYMYKYTDSGGESRFVYSWTLTQTDRPPKGKCSEKCLREMEQDIAKDLQTGVNTFKSKKLTLNLLFEAYMEQRKELKPSTRSLYRSIYERYVWDSLGRMKVSDVRYSDIKKFYNHLIYDMDLSFKTVSLVHAVLKPIFTMAVRDEIIRANPTNDVIVEVKKSCGWKNTKRHALTEPEQKAFISFIKTHATYRRWLPLFTVLLGTGCRIGEALGLTWDDCDFEEEIISINHCLNYNPDEYTGKSDFHISTPKTLSSKREIPMFSAVKKALLEEREKQSAEGFIQPVIDGYSNFVFVSRNNTVFLYRNINNTINNITKRYNAEESKLAEKQGRVPLLLPNFSVHNLRHTFCTRMCENGTDIKVVQEIMGHSNISTTMDIYDEATRDRKKQAFVNIDGMMDVY